MQITRLSIENLKSFERAEVEFSGPGARDMLFPNINVLLGGNGSGKSTLLRAVALAVLGPLLAQSSGFVPEGMIRRTGKTASAKPSARSRAAAASLIGCAQASVILDAIELTAEQRRVAGKPLALSTRIEQIGDTERLKVDVPDPKVHAIVERMLFESTSRGFFVVGYGATRRVEASARVDQSARLKARAKRYERVASLFEDHVGLMPLSFWLPEYQGKNPGRHAQVIHLLNELLPPHCQVQAKASETAAGREHLFEMNGVALPFRALSDGYRAYIGWIGDMLFHLCMGSASGLKLRDTRGIALVDEIDLHLHPDWQRTVLPTLARALPHMQFIVTTHSPLVVGSLEASNLHLLQTDDRGRSSARRLPEKVHGRDAEQILLSPYFGLSSTRAPEVEQQMRKLSQKAVQGDARASIDYLTMLSTGNVSVAKTKGPAGGAARPATKSTAKAKTESTAKPAAKTAPKSPPKSPPKVARKARAA